MRNHGFTLIELIVIITVLGVLAISATARFGGTDVFEVRGVRDQLASAARDAQRYARNSGCPATFTVGGGSYGVTTTVPCGGGVQTVTRPGGAVSGSVPAGVSVTGATVTFDAYGAASAGTTVTVSSGASSASFTIQASGYVDLP